MSDGFALERGGGNLNNFHKGSRSKKPSSAPVWSSKDTETIQAYLKAEASGDTLNPAAIVAALKVCTKHKDLTTGIRIHDCVQRWGELSNSFIASTLVDMYAKCGRLDDATILFRSIGVARSEVSWNCIILGHAENGEPELALDLLSLMKEEGFTPTYVTYLAALKACEVLADKEQSVLVHGQMVKPKSLSNVRKIHLLASAASQAGRGDLHMFVANRLVDLYTKCGSLQDSCKVFRGMKSRSVVSWTSLIMGYAEAGQGKIALELYDEMKNSGCARNYVTLIAALKACVSMAVGGEEKRSLEVGRVLHLEATRAGHDRHLFVGNALVDMYARCGSMSEALKVFESMKRRCVVSWTGMIMRYAENGDGEQAMKLHRRMRDEGCVPNYVTYLATLKACICLAEKEESRNVNGKLVKPTSLQTGRELHSQAVVGGHEQHLYVANALLDMYSKCGSLLDVYKLFESMKVRDLVSWNTLILACVDNGEAEPATEFYSRLVRHSKFSPDAITFVAVLKAFGSLGALQFGRQIEMVINNAGLHVNPLVGNSLVGFYGKCSCMEDAERVFNGMKIKDVVSWNALMDGYSRQSDTDKVFELFERMQDDGEEKIEPNEISFLFVLTVCCHAGLVEEGKYWLKTMEEVYGVVPTLKHFTCVVDLLGRVNRLEEAVEMVRGMPCVADSVIWTSIMDAANKWKNVEVGKTAFEAVVRLENTSAAYVMMSNITSL